MKRPNRLIAQIADSENLNLAFWKAQRSKQAKSEVIGYRANLGNNLNRLKKEILSGNVSVGNYHYFKIYDPKERNICAASFHERVLHHALMNVCHPYFERQQIFDSYATRPDKGTFAALDRAAMFSAKYKWFSKNDFRKYFDSINHTLLKTSLAELFIDKHLLHLFSEIIDSYSVSENAGIPIGNLTSQYFANHYLSSLDHQLKEQHSVAGYVRYMDDIVLWGNDKETLIAQTKQLSHISHQKLNLELKPPCIHRTAAGLPFLGFVLYPNHIKLSRRSKLRYIKKMKENCMKMAYGEISQLEFQQKILPLIAFAEYADSKKLRVEINKRFDHLFE